MLSRMPLDVGAFVAVDLETTGSLPGRDSIIEIGVARLEAGVVTDLFRTFVRPSRRVPPSVTHLTGITDEMLAEAPPIAEAMERMRDFIGGAVVIAHNHRFDLGFLDHEAECLWGAPFRRPVLDTLAIARKIDRHLPRHNLRELAGAYRTSLPTHRALDDAVTTAQVFAGMSARLMESGLRTAGDVAAFCGMRLQTRLAGKLMLAHDAPDAPGVFLFRDETGAVTFVDRAKNLRSRVRGHFYAVSEASAESPALDASRVEWIACASELDAVLLESRLLQRYHPQFNRQGERGYQPSHLTARLDSPFPALEVVDRLEPGAPGVGPFTNRCATETLADGLRVEFDLRRCVARLSADSVVEPCVFRDSASCVQPCVRAVDESAYRERLAEALASLADSADGLRFRFEEAYRQASADNAARYGELLRSLDRCMNTLDILNAEVSRPPSVIIEGTAEKTVIHIMMNGYREGVIRARRDQLVSGMYLHRLRPALSHLCSRPAVADPLRLTSRQLKDLFLIRGYRELRQPFEIELPSDAEQAVAAVASAIRDRFTPGGTASVAV